MDKYFDVIKGELKEEEETEETEETEEKEEKDKHGINDDNSDEDEFKHEHHYKQALEAKSTIALKQRIFEIKKQKRMNIAVHVILTFVLQFVLVIMTFKELVTNCTYS